MMYLNKEFQRAFIISEIHPQFHGDMHTAQIMMMQSKLGGADAVKVQLYDSMALFNNLDREYVQISKSELKEMKHYADEIGIALFASIFTPDRVDWCEELGFEYYKIASPTVKDVALCNLILSLNKPTLISLGMWDWKTKGLPFERANLVYFYCISQYPTMLGEIEMPWFGNEETFQGYSDHTIDIDACVYAVARGATYIEKHFTLNKSLFFATEKGHTGAMDLDDLRQLRKFADSFSILKKKAEL